MSDPGCTAVDDRITQRLLYAVDGADPRPRFSCLWRRSSVVPTIFPSAHRVNAQNRVQRRRVLKRSIREEYRGVLLWIGSC